MSRPKNENVEYSVIYQRGWTAFDCLEALLRLRVGRAGKDYRDTNYYLYEFPVEEWADQYDGKAVTKIPALRLTGNDLDEIVNADAAVKPAFVKNWVIAIEDAICAPALPPIPPEFVKSCKTLDHVAKLMMRATKKATREFKYMKTVAPEAKLVGNLGLSGVLEAARFLFNDGNVRPLAQVLAQYTTNSAIAEREVLLYRGRYPETGSMFYHQVEDTAKYLETIQWYMDGFNAQRFPCPGNSRYGRK